MQQNDIKRLPTKETVERYLNFRERDPDLFLETPFDILDKMLRCKQTRSSSFIMEKRPGPSFSKESRSPRSGTSSSFKLSRRIWASLRRRDHFSALPPEYHDRGNRYLIDSFPAFDNRFPKHGLSVGKGHALHWIKPVRVEFKVFDAGGISVGDELICTFSLYFRDGHCGEAGYMDRIKPDGQFSRWHIYPYGDIISADLYRDHRTKHDIFRTLMGKILLGEIYSEHDDR